MTREQHIKAAERLLGHEPGCTCRGCFTNSNPTDRDIARAHVHALLALAMSRQESAQ